MTETTICRLDDLTDGEGARFDVGGHRLAVVCIGDDVYVIGDRCTHAEASLAEGEVDAERKHIECWRHGSMFSLETGEPDVLPAAYPNLLGIGLSEGTAIIVKGDQFEVMGKWKVAVHDNTRLYQPWEKPYFVLSPGDVYNMKARRVEKYGTGQTPGRRGGTG